MKPFDDVDSGSEESSSNSSELDSPPLSPVSRALLPYAYAPTTWSLAWRCTRDWLLIPFVQGFVWSVVGMFLRSVRSS